MQMTALKVGDLAKQTGVSVRTLHYYDEIDLLSPSEHTEAGYRLYTAGDIARLQQIRSLRQLGFSLDDIRSCLDRPDFSLQRVVELHLRRLREQLVTQYRLCGRLEAIAASLRSAEEVSVEVLISTIEEMTNVEHHFTPEQMAEIQERGRQLGDEHIRQVEAEWPTLIASVRAEMEQGTDPADPRVQALARRWMELVREFTGGNPGIQQVLNKRYQEDTQLQQRTGIDLKLNEYVVAAITAAKQGE